MFTQFHRQINLHVLVQCVHYSTTPLIRSNWDGEASGYAENPDN